MQNLTPLVHNSLEHGDTVEPLKDDERQCLEELRTVLQKHGKLNRFGVTLLHKHFDLSEDEILVENVDEQTRTQIIKPMKLAAVAAMGGEILETCWSLQEGETLTGCRRACVKQDNKHYPGVHVWS